MPKQTPDLPLPGIHLDATAEQPLHRQLYRQLSQAIRLGHLKPGTRLPSTRALAAELGVSRTTTSEAYRDLHAEGSIESHVGAGTLVSERLPLVQHDPAVPALPTRLSSPLVFRRAWR